MAVSHKQRQEKQELTHLLPATPPTGPRAEVEMGGSEGTSGSPTGKEERLFNVQRCALVARPQTVAASSLQRSV